MHKHVHSILAGAALIAVTSTQALAGDFPAGHWTFDTSATEAAYKVDGKSQADIQDALGEGSGTFIDWGNDTFQVMLSEGLLYIKCQWHIDDDGKIRPMKCVDEAGKPAIKEQNGIVYIDWGKSNASNAYLITLHIKGGGAWVYRK